MALATLSIDLVARLASLEKDMGIAVKTVERGASGIVGALGTIKTAVTAVIGGAFVAGMTSMVTSTANVIDSFNDLKDATGASIENISALESLARRTGTSYEAVSGILVKFNQVLNEAKPDNDAGRVIRALGLDVEKLKAMDPAEALRVTAVAMQGFANDGNLARATQVLFSKSVKEAAPFLKDLAEAGKLNATATTQQAEEAEKFNKQLFQLRSNAEDAKRELVSGLIPALNSLFERYKEGGVLGALGFGKEFHAKRELASIASEVIELDGHLKKLKNDAEKGINFFGTPESVRAQVDAVAAQLEDAKVRFRIASRQSLAASAGPWEAGFTPQDQKSLKVPSAPGTPSAYAKLQEEIAQRLSAAYQQMADPLKELTQAEQFAIKVVSDLADAKSKLTASEKQLLTAQLDRYLVTAKQADLDKAVAKSTVADAERIARARADARNKEYDEINAFQTQVARADEDAIAALLKKTPGAELAEQRRLQGVLAEKFMQGRFGDPESQEAARTYGEVASTALGNIASASVETANSAEQFGSAFSQAFDNAIFGAKDLMGVLGSLAKSVVSIGIQQAVTKPAGEWFGKALSGMFGFADGGIMTATGPLPLKKYANGGVATRPQLAMFGEGRTPEAFVPLPDGRRIPVAMKGGGGRALSIVYNIHTSDMVNKQELQDHLRTSERRTVAAMNRSMNYGGQFA